MPPRKRKLPNRFVDDEQFLTPNARMTQPEPPNAANETVTLANTSDYTGTTQPVIDYDKLAAAMLPQQAVQRQPVVNNIQQSASDSVEIPTNDESSQSNMQSCEPASVQPITSGSFDNANSCTTFGSFIDRLFSGESVANASSSFSHPIPISVNEGIPLGNNIPLRLKQKIWNEQFVDFKSLLPNNKETNIAIQIENNSISFNNQHTSQASLSLHQWTNAFFIFIAIYVEKKPHECNNLLKYGFTVRELGSTHGDAAWRFYDENFRKLRQSNLVPWQLPVTEYVVKASTLSQPFRAQVKNKSQIKFCYNYNNGTKCKVFPCQFKHACQNCRQSHPRIKCTVSQRADNKTSTASNATNSPKAKSTNNSQK
ncbi:hypothetical protein FSP39_016300 [Pinctada imbricata]|uniref:C3H1-type domain-containing protein n=1 Tax=Pinctada imbricata TaxID=66713 RepID=A0AA88YL76_PINIB|nr:hypothetical protein FSP39_016300 [Pinctada imbricata]